MAYGSNPKVTKMQPIEGKSLSDFFTDKVTGRTTVLTGREHNDMARPHGGVTP